MTNFQGKTWPQYRNECKAAGVEPVRADWLGITYSDEELETRNARSMYQVKPKAMSAAPGR